MTKPNIDKKRHLFKSLTWRIIASLTSFLLAWGVTGNIEAGLSIGAADVVIKFLLYYFHERIWYSFDYGVKKSKNKSKKP
jgi:uncharacterized membrane protein